MRDGKLMKSVLKRVQVTLECDLKLPVEILGDIEKVHSDVSIQFQDLIMEYIGFYVKGVKVLD